VFQEQFIRRAGGSRGDFHLQFVQGHARELSPARGRRNVIPGAAG
jgi:hypothetical protein